MRNVVGVVRVEPKFVSAHEVAEVLGVSESTGYRLIREMNNELKKQGKITISGKISRRYFEEKIYL
jgi:predicted DNA-binding transcriptional regulator AlpA